MPNLMTSFFSEMMWITVHFNSVPTDIHNDEWNLNFITVKYIISCLKHLFFINAQQKTETDDNNTKNDYYFRPVLVSYKVF